MKNNDKNEYQDINDNVNQSSSVDNNFIGVDAAVQNEGKRNNNDHHVRKENQTKNTYLKESGYYDRPIFYHFLQQARI